MNPETSAAPPTVPDAGSEPNKPAPTSKIKNQAIATSEHNLTGTDEAKLKDLLHRHDRAKVGDTNWGPVRNMCATIVTSKVFDVVMGGVILAQFVLAIEETNLAAVDLENPDWLAPVMYVFLSLYVWELSMKFYVFRRNMFETGFAHLDIAIVGLDVLLVLFKLAVGTKIPTVGVVRVFRLVRLIRAMRVLTTFQELYIMLHSFLGAMKAMFWATLMILIVLTIWAIIIVELLHPLNEGLDHGDCERCSRAYSSVYHANLTLFQQIITGDSWGMITINMIENHPISALIYIPCFICVGMGMMNLTLTVIVDRASDARRANEQERLKLKLSVIKVLFSQMDDDNSGCVTCDEFMEGLRNNEMFEKCLSLVGIRIDDVKTIFEMMDLDGTGTVSYDEFIENLSKMKNEESFMILLYVKHFMSSMEHKLEHCVDTLRASTELSIQRTSQAELDKMDNVMQAIARGSDGMKTAKFGQGEMKSDSSRNMSPELTGQRASADDDLASLLRSISHKMDMQLAAQTKQYEYLSRLGTGSAAAASASPIGGAFDSRGAAGGDAMPKGRGGKALGSWCGSGVSGDARPQSDRRLQATALPTTPQIFPPDGRFGVPPGA